MKEFLKDDLNFLNIISISLTDASFDITLVSDSKLDGSVVKQYTKSSKKQVYSLPNVVTKTTTVTMVKVTDEKVTTV